MAYPRWHKLTAEQREQIVADYLAGGTSCELASEYGTSATNIVALIKRRGIERRGRRECRVYRESNQDYFSRIDSEAKAYWLGFLAADGHVGGNEIVLALAIKDIDHVRLLRTYLQSTHKIGVYERNKFVKGAKLGSTQVVRLSIRSPKMSGDLNKAFGLIWNCQLDMVITQRLQRHFWRGVIDGDGSIGEQGPGRPGGSPRWFLNLTTDRELCVQFLEFAKRQTGTTAKVYDRQGCSCVSMCGTKIIRKAVKSLYDQSSVHLARKKIIATNISEGIFVKFKAA